MGGIRDGKGKVLRKTGPLFTELARNYPSNNYTNFCLEFGVGFAEANQILKIQNLGNQENALKQVLNRWLDEGKDVTRKKLESALENAETGGLKSIVKKHFAKANLEEESSESSEDESHSSPPTDRSSEGEESASRKGRKVRGKRSGTKRKSNDSTPGSSTSHKKKKVRPDNTKVTDSVIVALAKDIGINNNLDKLGLELGFGLSDMKMYTAQNHAHGSVAYAGTKQMFLDWRDDKGEGKPVILKKALVQSGLTLYAEKYFGDL